VRAFAISNRPSGRAIAGAKAAINTDGQKMIAARVKDSYASLASKYDHGTLGTPIAWIGPFEVRLFEMPSVNSREGLNLWVELYDRDLRVSVDSCKCSDLDEAMDAAQLLITQAGRLNDELGRLLPSTGFFSLAEIT
jgi:hypothetical protein